MNLIEKIDAKLIEANMSYVVTNDKTTIRIKGFKKGDDTDMIGDKIIKKLDKPLKGLNIKEVNIQLK